MARNVKDAYSNIATLFVSWTSGLNCGSRRSLFRVYWLPVMYFSCSLLTKNNIISLAICVINTCKLSKDYKFHLPYGLVIFCCLWKIYSCLLTPSSLEIIFLPILIAWLRWWGEARMNFFSSRRSRGLIKRVILSSYSVRHFVCVCVCVCCDRGKKQRDYTFIPTSLFRDCSLIRGFYC